MAAPAPDVESQNSSDKVHTPLSLHYGPSTTSLAIAGTTTIPPVNLLLLDSGPKPLPKWMKYYRIASYLGYFGIACFSWIYLGFIASYQAHPRMQIQYTSVVSFLEFNSYSILSPLLCSVFMCVLAYHVRKRIQLDDGDFFGLLGVLLFFALINIHDGYGVLKLITSNSKDYDNSSRSVLDPPPRDPTSKSDYHWQYAWSTRPSCARKFVRDLTYQHEYDKKHVKQQVLVEFIAAQSREAAVISGLAMDCNEYHDKKEKAKIRQWMVDLQNEFKCCGPYGYKMWQKWFSNKKLTGCDEKWTTQTDIPSCYDPLVRWLNGIFFSTVIIMFAQATLYVVSMILACMHYAAMKYEHAAVGKTYSLLDMTDLRGGGGEESGQPPSESTDYRHSFEDKRVRLPKKIRHSKEIGLSKKFLNIKALF